jgi:hypothetical protein
MYQFLNSIKFQKPSDCNNREAFLLPKKLKILRGPLWEIYNTRFINELGRLKL